MCELWIAPEIIWNSLPKQQEREKKEEEEEREKFPFENIKMDFDHVMSHSIKYALCMVSYAKLCISFIQREYRTGVGFRHRTR